MFKKLVEEIDALLPQTQCTKCGYPGCRPYADAIAAGVADIDQCPPGGALGVAKLAALLGRESKPLNPAYGLEQPRTAALIDERWCIGCTLCIEACPVDAIVGAPKRMHTVVLEYCTGCELCLPPCPVDCIQLVALDELARRGASVSVATAEQRAARARSRYHLRQKRRPLERRAADGEGARAITDHHAAAPSREVERRRQAVRAALQRSRARRASARDRKAGKAFRGK